MDAGGKTRFGARYDFEVVRNGEVIDRFSEWNTIPDAALTNVLATYLNSGTQTGTWYVALLANDYNMVNAPNAVAGDIGTTISEFINYSGNRPTIVFGTAAAKVISNSASVAEFNINSTGGTVYGGFIVSTGTKNSVLGTLFSIVKLGTAKSFDNGDVVKVTVTVTAASV